jgi:CelD/BcsL family acetyltransferase involved in cellulose biosynthesis
VQRRRRKRIRGELEALGELRFEILQDGPSFGAVIDLAIAEKRAWLAERDLYSRPLASERLSNFVKTLANTHSSQLKIMASVLSAGGVPVSFEIGLRCKDRHYAYITAHERTLTPLSPARLHMHLSQRQAIRDGMATFDLMVPGDPHKESWSNGTMAVADYYAPLNWRGRLYGKGYLEWLRPLLKRGYRAAPPALRRPALRFAGRVS